MVGGAGNDSSSQVTRFEILKRIDIMPTQARRGFLFRNYYCCPNDQTTWNDDWSCMCNDKCPICGTEVEPYESEDI
jgi:hypothetical protein